MPDIDNHIINGAAWAPHEFRLCPGRGLKMKAAHRARSTGSRDVILHEIGIDASKRLKPLCIPDLFEPASLIAEPPGLDQKRILERSETFKFWQIRAPARKQRDIYYLRV